MRTTARRISDGEALRQAMTREHVGLQALADRTARMDPAGKGVSVSLLGFLTQDPSKRHARETCSVESAALIEDALGAPRGTLFELIEVASRSDPQPSWDDLKNVSA